MTFCLYSKSVFKLVAQELSNVPQPELGSPQAGCITRPQQDIVAPPRPPPHHGARGRTESAHNRRRRQSSRGALVKPRSPIGSSISSSLALPAGPPRARPPDVKPKHEVSPAIPLEGSALRPQSEVIWATLMELGPHVMDCGCSHRRRVERQHDDRHVIVELPPVRAG